VVVHLFAMANTPATQLLISMLASQRITQTEFSLLHSAVTSPVHAAAIDPRTYSYAYSRSAATRVLNTVELLENILLQSSTSDILLRLQLVSRSWKNTIDGSVGIARLLFRQPDPLARWEFFPMRVKQLQTDNDYQIPYEKAMTFVLKSGTRDMDRLEKSQALQQSYVSQPPLEEYRLVVHIPLGGVPSRCLYAPSGLTFAILWREVRKIMAPRNGFAMTPYPGGPTKVVVFYKKQQ
jgi:hypothetical protein